MVVVAPGASTPTARARSQMHVHSYLFQDRWQLHACRAILCTTCGLGTEQSFFSRPRRSGAVVLGRAVSRARTMRHDGDRRAWTRM